MANEMHAYEMPEAERVDIVNWLREDIAHASAELETKAARYVALTWKHTTYAVRLINECDELANRIRVFELACEKLSK